MSATLLLVLVLGDLAETRPAPAGALSQLQGRSGCLSATGRDGCTRARALAGTDAVTVSPDGRNVYAASENSDSVTVFGRDRRTGVLSQLAGRRGCASTTGRQRCARGRGLRGAYDVAIDPGGRHAYVPGEESNAVAVFARDRRSGALRQLAGERGCQAVEGREGCARARALDGAFGAAVSPDGRHVYAAAEFSDAVAAFARDRRSGTIEQLSEEAGCISRRGRAQCTPGRGLDGATSVTLSPDGRTVYAAGSDGVAVLRRDPATGALRQPPGRRGCIAVGGAEGCARGRALGGTVAVAITVTRDGRNVYVASSAGNAVVVLARNPRTGDLRQLRGRRGCIALNGRRGCTRARGLTVPTGVAVAPNGRRVYASEFAGGAVFAFARSRRDGALGQLRGRRACIGPAKAGCRPGRGLGEAVDVIVSPVGRSVYVSSEDGGLAAFRAAR